MFGRNRLAMLLVRFFCIISAITSVSVHSHWDLLLNTRVIDDRSPSKGAILGDLFVRPAAERSEHGCAFYETVLYHPFK